MTAKPADNHILISNLEFIVERAQKRVSEAKEVLSKAQEVLAHAEALLAHERGLVRTKPSTRSSRFREMSFGEAAKHVVQEANGKEISAVDIWDILRSNGFTLNHDKPGRAIHAAFINAEEIERTGRATYRTRKTSVVVN